MREEFVRLRKQLRKQWPQASLDVLRLAYRRADAAHQGQLRASGEPYIMHPLAVAQILANLGLDPVTCSAGLLHDVIEDTELTNEDLRAEFGAEVTALVEGVTKIGNLSFAEKSFSAEAKHAQNVRKMLVATAKDVRVILIKLADRLHNMRTVEALPEHKRKRIARETLEIFAPLAHRLGVSAWKWELEDHAFHQLMPKEYKEISRELAMRRRDRERYIEETSTFLEQKLRENEMEARVIGRPKHLYSIYRKMVDHGKEFHEVLDLLGIRIITQTPASCYNALGVVHSLWTPVPGRMKDYIAMPKLNMYQAIHTTVMRENGKPMEVQIRTEEMDKMAREGIAAHWIYKEGETRDPKLDRQLTWFRQMYEWLKDAHAPEELVDSMHRDFTLSNIYVFSPKGEVKELPSGATPLDYAYLVHSDIGHRCIGARVNGRMVPLRYHLQTGDMCEILSAKNQQPEVEWLDIVVTGRARTRIRQRLRELGELDAVHDPMVRPAIEPAPPAVPAPHYSDLVNHVDESTRQKLIRIDGSRGVEVKFAKCCKPMPGHRVVAYETQVGISVHRADCKSFLKSNPDAKRVRIATWEGDEEFNRTVRVILGPRPNALTDLTAAMRPINVDIVTANYMPLDGDSSCFEFTYRTSDSTQVDRIMRALRTVAGVIKVMRVADEVVPLAKTG